MNTGVANRVLLGCGIFLALRSLQSEETGIADWQYWLAFIAAIGLSTAISTIIDQIISSKKKEEK